MVWRGGAFALKLQEDPRTTYGANFAPELRAAVARLFARHFVVHLQAELLKPDEILQRDYADIPARTATQVLLARVRAEFAIPTGEALPAENLFRIWMEIDGKYNYDELSFIGYSHIYFNRLLDLRDGTSESLERLLVSMRAVFDKFDYQSQRLPISLFLHLENLMRELMRQIVNEDLPEHRPRAKTSSCCRAAPTSATCTSISRACSTPRWRRTSGCCTASCRRKSPRSSSATATSRPTTCRMPQSSSPTSSTSAPRRRGSRRRRSSSASTATSPPSTAS
ncbi:MAG: hypothetical protein WDO13_09860 [Verrucomicrobiota bacterium]